MPRPIYGARRKAAKPLKLKHYENNHIKPNATIKAKVINVIEKYKDSAKYFFMVAGLRV